MLAHPLLDLGLSVPFAVLFDVFSPNFGSTTLIEVVGGQMIMSTLFSFYHRVDRDFLFNRFRIFDRNVFQENC